MFLAWGRGQDRVALLSVYFAYSIGICLVRCLEDLSDKFFQ